MSPTEKNKHKILKVEEQDSTACLADRPCRQQVHPLKLQPWPTINMLPTESKIGETNTFLKLGRAKQITSLHCG